MKKLLKTSIKRLFAKPSVSLAARWPQPWLLAIMRRLNAIQLSPHELRTIITALKRKAPCNFLVFGLGNDSRIWLAANRGGRTVFIEDNEAWFAEIVARERLTNAYLVDYETRLTQWRELLDQPITMHLPGDLEQYRWDVIFVDAPGGWSPDTPGRMKSIFLASQVAQIDSDVFVHDCNREVERVYCDRFLGRQELTVEMQLLRHYRITS